MRGSFFFCSVHPLPQAEISEMFAQTVQAEKLKASTPSAGTLESEEGGPLKRKSGSEQVGLRFVFRSTITMTVA